MTSRAYSAAGLERTRGGRIPSSQRFRGIDSKGRRCEQRIHPPPQLSRHCKPCALFPKPCQSDPGSHLTDRNHTFKKLLMHGRAPSGMGIFPKSETRCHTFSFLWGCTNGGILFCESRDGRGNTREKEHPPLLKKDPPLVQPATTISRFVWPNSVERAK